MIAVVGGTGQIGLELAARGPHVVPISRGSAEQDRRADIRERHDVRRVFKHLRPADVILAAAATNVAWCEENPEEARAINVVGTRIVCEEADAIGARLTFISTDYVFGGEAGPYSTSATPSPLNVYGRQKLEAEELVLSWPHNIVVRTCQVFGPDPRRRNFVLSVVDRIRAAGRVEASPSLFGTPTYGPSLVSALLARLSTGDPEQLIHVAGDTYLSRFELASLAAQACGFDPATVVPAEVALDHVERPLRSGLISTTPLPPLIESLRELAASERPRLL
jgi:dTDP-4-dehydrorhamnose reductase